ncbi:MAG: hypothetical protein AAB329_00870 [Pseudomonadota bacterium]
MLVKDIMTQSVKVARPDDLVRDVVSVMCFNKISGMPVVDAEEKMEITPLYLPIIDPVPGRLYTARPCRRRRPSSALATQLAMSPGALFRAG